MTEKNASMKAFLPALGIVFGAAAGLLICVLCNFQITFGAAFGAAVGLLIGLALFNLLRKKDTPQSGDGA